MQTINKRDLPIVLQNSQLVNQLDNDFICVPIKYVINNIDIKNNDDFYKIMDILRYYMIDELPFEIYDYVKNNKVDLSDFKDFFFDELTMLSNTNNDDLMNECAKKGYLNLMKYARENGYTWDSRTCAYAAYYGHLDCLKYAYENGCEWDSFTCSSAAKHSYLECLKYAHENGCAWDWFTCSEAAAGGDLECLKYAHENGCAWNSDTCCYATEFGHLNCLKYAYENGCKINIQECLKYAKTDEIKEYLNSINK